MTFCPSGLSAAALVTTSDTQLKMSVLMCPRRESQEDVLVC